MQVNIEAINQVYNIAHGERTTLNFLFEHIRGLTGKNDPEILKIKPVYGPVRGGDIEHSLASIDKAKRLLGYSPVQNVREGLAESIEWYRRNL